MNSFKGADEYDPIASAKSIGLSVAKLAPEGEKMGCISQGTIELLRDSGMLGLWRPKELGGHECDPLTYAKAAEEVAKYDSAAAWIMHGTSASWLDLRSADTDFVDEVIASAKDPVLADTYNKPMNGERTGGGIRVSGFSPFASGCKVADWIGHTAIVDDSLLLVFHPQGNLEISDDWDSLGIRASASNTVVADQVFVPKHRIIDITNRVSPAGPFSGDLYRLPVAIVPAAIAAVALGVLNAALETTTDIAERRVRFSSTSSLKTKLPAQIHFGRALAAYRAARGYLHNELRNAFQRAQRCEEFSLQSKADLFLAYAHVLQSVNEAVRGLTQAVGTAAIHKGTILERAFRDAEVASHHAFGAEGRFGSVTQAYWQCDVDFPMITMD